VGSTNRQDADLHVLGRGSVEHAQRARHRDVPSESHPLRRATPAQAGVCVGAVTRSSSAAARSPQAELKPCSDGSKF
jgi:hypothetical protein